MGKCRRLGVTRALLRASLGLQLANPGEEFRRPRWVAGTGMRSRRIRFTSLHPALTLAATIPAPMVPFSPWPPAPPFASSGSPSRKAEAGVGVQGAAFLEGCCQTCGVTPILRRRV